MLEYSSSRRAAVVLARTGVLNVDAVSTRIGSSHPKALHNCRDASARNPRPHSFNPSAQTSHTCDTARYPGLLSSFSINASHGIQIRSCHSLFSFRARRGRALLVRKSFVEKLGEVSTTCGSGWVRLNYEVGPMSAEVKTLVFEFIVHRSAFTIHYLLQPTRYRRWY